MERKEVQEIINNFDCKNNKVIITLNEKGMANLYGKYVDFSAITKVIKEISIKTDSTGEYLHLTYTDTRENEEINYGYNERLSCIENINVIIEVKNG